MILFISICFLYTNSLIILFSKSFLRIQKYTFHIFLLIDIGDLLQKILHHLLSRSHLPKEQSFLRWLSLNLKDSYLLFPGLTEASRLHFEKTHTKVLNHHICNNWGIHHKMCPNKMTFTSRRASNPALPDTKIIILLASIAFSISRPERKNFIFFNFKFFGKILKYEFFVQGVLLPKAQNLLVSYN